MRRTIAVFAALLLSAATLPCAGQTDAAHREAIQRYLEASRTVAFLRHFGMPIEIRTAAVERWGFESSTLSVDEIRAMEAHVDVAEFERQVVALHARHITAEDADAVARFYASAPGRRYLGSAMGPAGFLPSTDPLIRDGIPPRLETDKTAFQDFLRTPAGIRIKQIAEPPVTAGLFVLLKDFADRAIERYVAERKLPNRRLPR